tara:strand:- start:3369 stop:4685 length:1317 start_codon:yes stop_codon:yes gene_type:complete
MTVFFRQNFSGVSMRASKEICEAAEISEKDKPPKLKPDDIRSVLEVFQGEKLLNGKPVKLLSPPTNCLSPIEELLIKKGLSKTIDSKFISTMTRAPNVSHGNPFQIEVGLIFGEGMQADSHVEILRFANRVPLMYQQGGCLLTKAIESVDWRQYGLDQSGGKGVPKGPAAILIHLASTNVQFTSEAKEALADNEIVFEEGRKAMLEMGRGLRKHLEKKKKMAKTREKFELINDILPAIAEKSASILDRPVPQLAGSITKIMSAVIVETVTNWNRETKHVDVKIILFNYTSRARQYTVLTNWPEKEGGQMLGNDRGGRKEATGLWAWKIETLSPGEQAIIEYSISGLEKGDWTDTDVFYRGSQEIIGATRMDEQMLEEIRKQEEADRRALEESLEEITHEMDDNLSEDDVNVPSEDLSPVLNNSDQNDSRQTTLFGGEA